MFCENIQIFSDVEARAYRDLIIDTIRFTGDSLPRAGSNFFIHLTELCPVECPHCMYASTLARKSLRDAFSDEELERVIVLIGETQSSKLTISGGGEPFLKFSQILRLVETVDVRRIEIVTAGHWARTEARATTILAALERARAANPASPDVDLRLSIDRFHINAPRGVTLANYANVATAWSRHPYGVRIGYRSLLVDRDTVDVELAAILGADLLSINDWNRQLILKSGARIPLTYNVFRYSGSARDWVRPDGDETGSVRDYYRQFEREPGKLVLATAVNDALHGQYQAEEGVAITLNSDGTMWIFCGTAPDRKLRFSGQSFDEVVRYFYQDPITRLLVTDGIWRLADMVRDVSPVTYEAADGKQDVTSLVDDLLHDPKVCLEVTIRIVNRMIAAGKAYVEPDRGFIGPAHLLVRPEFVDNSVGRAAVL